VCFCSDCICQSRKALTGNTIRKAVQEKVCSPTKLLSSEDPFLGLKLVDYAGVRQILLMRWHTLETAPVIKQRWSLNNNRCARVLWVTLAKEGAVFLSSTSHVSYVRHRSINATTTIPSHPKARIARRSAVHITAMCLIDGPIRLRELHRNLRKTQGLRYSPNSSLAH